MRNIALLVLLMAVTQVVSQECDNTLTGTITDLHDGLPPCGCQCHCRGGLKSWFKLIWTEYS